MSNELNLDNVGDRYLQAEALIDVIYTMEQARGVSFTHVLALESAIPGLVMDSYPEGGFTPHVSQKNAELVYTAVNNWLASNGITVERHATESWGSAGKILAGVGIFAAVIALIKWIINLIRGGGSGGGGGSSSQVIQHAEKKATEAKDKVDDKVEKMVKEETNTAKEIIDAVRKAKSEKEAATIEMDAVYKKVKRGIVLKEKLTSNFASIGIDPLKEKATYGVLNDAKKLAAFTERGKLTDSAAETYDEHYAVNFMAMRAGHIVVEILTNAAKLDLKEHVTAFMMMAEKLMTGMDLCTKKLLDVAHLDADDKSTMDSAMKAVDQLEVIMKAGGLMTMLGEADASDKSEMNKLLSFLSPASGVDTTIDTVVGNIGKLDPAAVGKQLVAFADFVDSHITVGFLEKLSKWLETNEHTMTLLKRVSSHRPGVETEEEANESASELLGRGLMFVQMAVAYERKILMVFTKITAALRRYASNRESYYSSSYAYPDLEELLLCYSPVGSGDHNALHTKLSTMHTVEEFDKFYGDYKLAEFDKLMNSGEPLRF